MTRLLILAALAALAGPASGVGLGPLSKEGITDGPAKGFYLTVINPYAQAERFTLSPLALDSETPAPNVTIFPSPVVVGGRAARRVLIITTRLEPGQTYVFRVCAERAPLPQETIHARVCSKLAARRVRARG